MNFAKDRLGIPIFPVLGLFLMAGFGTDAIHAGLLFPNPVFRGGGGGGHSLAVADLNEDGVPDLVSGNSFDTVSVLLGQSDGTFVLEGVLQVGRTPWSVAIADLNSDGKLDLAVTNELDNDISVLLGLGGGAFSFHRRFPAGTGPHSVAAADFNADGRLDLAIANAFSRDVSVLLGNGLGSFAPQVAFRVGEARQLIIADFNGDGSPDIATANSDSGSVSVLLGNGSGSFGTAMGYFSGQFASSLTSADFNGDGHADLAVANQFSNDVTILMGQGDGRFLAQPVLAVGTQPDSIASGDLNRDGKLDLAVANYLSADVSVLLGGGDGTFTVQPPIAVNGTPKSIVFLDADQDGQQDIAHLGGSISGEISVLFGVGDGSFNSVLRPGERLNRMSVTLADFNGDGVSDAATANYSPSEVSVFLNQGQGRMAPEVRYPSGGLNPRQIVSRDVNLDSKIDLLVLHENSGDVTLLLGLGDGTFAPATRVARPSRTFVAVADFNRDEYPDLVFARLNFLTYTVDIELGNGDGTFQPGFTVAQMSASWATASDLNLDGAQDLVVASDSSPFLQVFLGRGDGSFTSPVALRVADSPKRIVVGDLNADGIPDLATLTLSGISVRLGQGDGTFLAEFAMYSGARYSTDLDVADLDQDGHQDILVTDQSSNAVLTFLGRGDGTFDPQLRYAAAGDPWDLAVGDLNGDGRADLAMGSHFGLSISLTVIPPDHDHDGTPDSLDLCTDRDGDGSGDPGFPANVCPVDNCPDTPNADQRDSNRDGSGDACQPTLRILRILQDGGDELEMILRARDPQNESLTGVMEFFLSRQASLVTLQDMSESPDCARGLLIGDAIGGGIGFAYGSLDDPVLFDLDSLFGCQDVYADYGISHGSCDDPSGSFQVILSLAGLDLPATLCTRRLGADSGGVELTVLAYDMQSLELSTLSERLLSLRIPFSGGVPQEADISALQPGSSYDLVITVTDGNTLPISDTQTFLYQGESKLVIQGPPVALVRAPLVVECDDPAGGAVALDGSDSTGSDTSAAGASGIVFFEWLEDPGQGSERVIASGAIAHVVLPVGPHLLGLRITDTQGATDTVEFSVTVRDSIPPDLICPGEIETECSGPEGARVDLIPAVTDTCGPVTIQRDTSPPPLIPGTYRLGTTIVAFTAFDASSNATSCSTRVTVLDTAAPILNLSAAPAVLWPPDHRMVPVHVSGLVHDVCDPAVGAVLASVSGSESDDAPGLGDGNTDQDIQGAALGDRDWDFDLRAERAAVGEGRVYSVTYTASDASGNQASSTLAVIVPHDRQGVTDPVTIAVRDDGRAGTIVSWQPVPGAASYSVIRGLVRQLNDRGNSIELGPVICVEAKSLDTDTTDHEDMGAPPVAEAFFYLVAFDDGTPRSYGSVSAAKPRTLTTADCP